MEAAGPSEPEESEGGPQSLREALAAGFADAQGQGVAMLDPQGREREKKKRKNKK